MDISTAAKRNICETKYTHTSHYIGEIHLISLTWKTKGEINEMSHDANLEYQELTWLKLNSKQSCTTVCMLNVERIIIYSYCLSTLVKFLSASKVSGCFLSRKYFPWSMPHERSKVQVYL